MEVLNDYTTSIVKAFDEIDENWRDYDGLVIAGTHSFHDTEMMIHKIKEARENGIPTLLICAGHQLGAIEWARANGIPDATSEEFGKGTFVVKKRLEGLKVGLHEGESWWSNYEVVIGWNIPTHFISVPYHPEYQSSFETPHPLLVKFLKNAKKYTMAV